MMNSWDIQFMKESVRDIVKSWNDELTILSPLPLDQQPNYNRMMREFTGEIKFTTIKIPAERKDIVNNQTNDIRTDNTDYGDRDDGVILYSISDVIPVYDVNNIQTGVTEYKPGKHDIFIIDDSDDRYYVRSMRDRIGETLVILYRFVGGTPNGTGTLESFILDNGG